MFSISFGNYVSDLLKKIYFIRVYFAGYHFYLNYVRDKTTELFIHKRLSNKWVKRGVTR